MSKAAIAPMGPASQAPRRLTQAERSEAMRKRLLEATLESLAEDGYAGTSLNSIVRRAGVSRGAQTHHYPSKQALILDAAEDLLRRSYRTLGQLILSSADEGNRLQTLIEATWAQLFDTPLYHAYAELLTASQRDVQLADALRELLLRVRRMFEPAIEHYFEPAPGAREDLRVLFLQLSFLMVGLSSQVHLFNDRGLVQAQIKLWIKQAAPLIRAKKGIKTPPPRPDSFDRPLAAD
ncbi:MAG: TetR/AcrR family transcriptional regulator [Nevskia sp.]|nr:TetR/AcrR family transcriptional regulator [Nevskia sp.]